MQITVGIPTLNGPDRLTRCLKSIEDYTSFNGNEIKVLVCDDGSTDENLQLNKDAIHRSSIPHLEMLTHNARRGIACGWNSLIRHQSCDIGVLLNDDVEVVRHWLDVLVHSICKNSHAGMVGLNCYTGLTRAQADTDFRIPEIDYNEARMLDGSGQLLSSHGYAFGFRRDLYDVIGGFDERYFCFYEEVDFGVALRHREYVHYQLSYPLVYHMGGATTTTLTASDFMEESRKKFEEKWGGTLEEVRTQLGKARQCPLNEWNTQLHNWR